MRFGAIEMTDEAWGLAAVSRIEGGTGAGSECNDNEGMSHLEDIQGSNLHTEKIRSSFSKSVANRDKTRR